MVDTAIVDFLSARKAARIKSKINGKTTADEKERIESDAAEAFTLANWLPSAARRAGQLSIASHPAKFSHPEAKTSSIVANNPWAADGFLRSGNVAEALDVFGNAAALDVYAFLSLTLSDGETILSHLERDTVIIQQQFSVSDVPFADISDGLLAIKENKLSAQKTSDLVKQVYFPVADEYHLLSLLTPSGLLFKLSERIRDIRFSEATKAAKDAKKAGAADAVGFPELYDLTVIGFGGTQPQNISLLNSKNAGVAYLLNSMPPVLTKRTVRLPVTDFFKDTVYPSRYKKDFEWFHKILIDNRNNKAIRQARDEVIETIINKVIEQGLAVRAQTAGWSAGAHYQALPTYQKLWLDNAYTETRELDDAWVDTAITAIARWFIRTYEVLLGSQALDLQHEELAHVRSIVTANQEGLR